MGIALRFASDFCIFLWDVHVPQLDWPIHHNRASHLDISLAVHLIYHRIIVFCYVTVGLRLLLKK